jgi:hypothetical protein
VCRFVSPFIPISGVALHKVAATVSRPAHADTKNAPRRDPRGVGWSGEPDRLNWRRLDVPGTRRSSTASSSPAARARVFGSASGKDGTSAHRAAWGRPPCTPFRARRWARNGERVTHLRPFRLPGHCCPGLQRQRPPPNPANHPHAVMPNDHQTTPPATRSGEHDRVTSIRRQQTTDPARARSRRRPRTRRPIGPA